MTPHINAGDGDIAKIVLAPGDPLRAKYIAENYLENYLVILLRYGCFFVRRLVAKMSVRKLLFCPIVGCFFVPTHTT